MRVRTRLQELQDLYSDIHKDVYGFRPRHASEAQWNDEAWLKAEVDYLAEELEVVLAQEQKVQENNVKDFEKKVSDLIASGAGNRETAVRWLCQANDPDVDFGYSQCHDVGYLEFEWNIPYGYIKGNVSAINN